MPQTILHPTGTSCFVSGSFLFSHQPAVRNAVSPSISPKRWRMTSSNNRSAEFSLNSNPDRLSSPAEPQPIDWDKWSSGKQMAIPAIPFPPHQVFLPGERKQLHLFEARYLALFETVVVDYDKKCAHVLIDSTRKAMAAFGTTIRIKSWRRLAVGIHVDFEAVGRLKTSKLMSSLPFLRGQFQVVDDQPMSETDVQNAKGLEESLWKAFDDVIGLCLKLGMHPIRPKIDTAAATIRATTDNVTAEEMQEEMYRERKANLPTDATRDTFAVMLKEAAARAINHEELDFSDNVTADMFRQRVYGLSFGAWDFFPSNAAMRQKAMEQKNTVSRLQTVVKGLEEHRRLLAAKMAVRNAFNV